MIPSMSDLSNTRVNEGDRWQHLPLRLKPALHVPAINACGAHQCSKIVCANLWLHLHISWVKLHTLAAHKLMVATTLLQI